MKEIVEHPNYDEFWQKRNLLPHLKNIRHAVMTVGGWFDAEDLAGPLNIYKTIEKNNPKIYNTIVMGPFSHGGWSRESGNTYHNDIYFGDSLATFYQKNIETPFFQHFLKDDKTVSYTHLDVYKRQAICITIAECERSCCVSGCQYNFLFSSDGQFKTHTN